jgi:glyoxalase-like protein
MLFQLDHVIVGVRDLRSAIDDWNELGLVASDGGSHPQHGTRNAIVRFHDGTFLELMAVADTARLREYAPVLLELLEQHPDTVIGYALRTDDIAAARAAVDASGVGVTPVWSAEGQRDSGRVATWQSFRIADPTFPFVVSYDGPPTSEPAASPLAPRGIAAVIVQHSDPAVFAERIARAFRGWRKNGEVTLASGVIRVDRGTKSAPFVSGIELKVDEIDTALAAVRTANARTKGAHVEDPRLHGLGLTLTAE